MVVEVDLVGMEAPKESWEMDVFEEKLEAALKRKTDGNGFFSKVSLYFYRL